MGTTTDQDLSAAVISAIQSGRKIEAIKILREESGMGLKEAKDAVEAYQRRHPEFGLSDGATGEASGGGLFVVGALIIASIAAYYFWQ